MTKRRIFSKYLPVAAVIAALVAADGFVAEQWDHGGFLITQAQAEFGRPLTPGSVAGVARRTTRRTIRRSAIYVSTLPRGCVRTTIGGAALWSCGGAYYQSSGGRYVVVYVD